VEEIDEFLKHVANFYYIESFCLVPSSTFIHNKLFSYDTYAETLRLLFNEKPATTVFKFLVYKSPSALAQEVLYKRFITIKIAS